MGFFSREKTISVYKVGELKIQGKHGRKPPEDAIRDLLNKWLTRFVCLFPEDTSLDVTIWGWTGFVRKVGVRVFGPFRRPLDNVIDVRVTVAENTEFTWRCQVVCPSAEVAERIVEVACPGRIAVASELAAKAAKNEPLQVPRRARRHYAKERLHPPLIAVEKMLKSSILTEVCFHLWAKHKRAPFVITEAAEHAAKLANIVLHDETKSEFAQALLTAGIIEPCLLELKTVLRFRGTEAMEERAHDFEELQRQAEIEILERRFDSCSRDQAAAEKELARLLEKVSEKREIISRLEKASSATAAELAKQRGLSNSEIFSD